MRIRTVHVALALAVAVAAAALLNPSPERHRARIKEVTAERSQLAALFRLGDLAAFVSNYHSLGVASYTTADGRVLSVGAFGIVVVLEHSERK
ncbi:MAG: hypothetical protein HZC37_21845 [Burkholderiales bacterium]|nr:hypothetical protein [Burkholderiales bacterium]